ncbi:hypothetical protein [Variovorax guangxiensis]|uniref:hypothetical protein n=1 Tax=Variovorax guangxiensis TaxID=1775474 RepID=UPI0028647ACD|nr:hypothetical protein [Variovorax guangxiensis]MDR6861295.1 hypothetical protein [Variovorax guangxiensis]
MKLGIDKPSLAQPRLILRASSSDVDELERLSPVTLRGGGLSTSSTQPERHYNFAPTQFFARCLVMFNGLRATGKPAGQGAPPDTPGGVGEVAGLQEVPYAIPLPLGGARAAAVVFTFLLADQTEPPRHIARHLGLSLRTLQRYAASGKRQAASESSSSKASAGPSSSAPSGR